MRTTRIFLLLAAPLLLARGAEATDPPPGQANNGLVPLPLEEEWNWGGMTLHAPRSVYMAPDAKIKPPTSRPAGTKWTFGTIMGAGDQRLNLALARQPDGRWFLHGGVNGKWDSEWVCELKKGGAAHFSSDKRGAVVEMGAPFFWNNRPVSLPRTAAVWIGESPDELLWSWRGFRRGKIPFEGQERAIVVADGNGNGSFGDARSDQLWIDRNGDNQLDPVSEQFAAAPMLKIDKQTYSFYVPPFGPARWKAIESGFGKARVQFKPANGGKANELAMTLVGQTGEAFAANKFNQELEVPAGKYQTASLSMGLLDRNKQPWRYTFVRGWDSKKSGIYPLEIKRNATVGVKPYEKILFSTGVPAGVKLKPGATQTVRLNLETEQSLQMTNTVKNNRNYNENMARIELRDAQGKVLANAGSGFA
jgi:hypothetical protein